MSAPQVSSQRHSRTEGAGLLSRIRTPNVRGLRSLGAKQTMLRETVTETKTLEVSLELDMVHLNAILRDAIKYYSKDKTLIETARTVSYHVGAVNKKIGRLSVGGLDQVASTFEAFVSTTPNLPSGVIAYAHTCLGLIRQEQERYSCAIHSLVKALWIRRSAHQSLDLIAVATYRLGIAYLNAGEFEDAKTALKQAIQYYSKAGLSMDHNFVVSAQNRLFELKTRHRALAMGVTKSHSHSGRRSGDADTVVTLKLTKSTSETRWSLLYHD